MPVRRIVLLGEYVLRSKSLEWTHSDETRPLRDLIFADLKDTLHNFQKTHGFGRGISAVQIGHLWRMIYIEYKGSCYELVNPVCAGKSMETMVMWDDCFSFPDILVQVRRHTGIVILYDGPNGEKKVLDASNDPSLAELLQHEIDHLDGILAVDIGIEGTKSLALRRSGAHL
ncbi:peptide deformylase [Pelomyxa schiedti]|nr:peptide deformylase [Pelomyxa schiedti]